jgi:surface carbohydrate biosynthesis protein
MKLFGRSICLLSPSRAEVAQFGAPIQALRSLSDTFLVGVVPTVGQEVNLRILLKSVLRGRLGRWGYYMTYFDVIGAKLVLIWHDTLTEAYLLRNHIEIPVFAVQNGIRSNISAVRGSSFHESLQSVASEGPRVDKYFCFGDQTPRLFGEVFQSEFLSVGSFRLNDYAAASPRREKVRASVHQSLALITSLPSRSAVGGFDLDEYRKPFIRLSEKTITFSEWFSPEAMVAQAVLDFCNHHDLTLSILSKRSAADSIDGDYFEKCVGVDRSAVLTHEKGMGYELADQFDYLVTIDSTLGYEMLALGKKVGFISNRLRMIGIDSDELTFAQSMNWSKDGAFWSSATSELEIYQFLTRFIEMSDADWKNCHANLTPHLMCLDPGNKILRSQIQSVLSVDR